MAGYAGAKAGAALGGAIGTFFFGAGAVPGAVIGGVYRRNRRSSGWLLWRPCRRRSCGLHSRSLAKFKFIVTGVSPWV